MNRLNSEVTQLLNKLDLPLRDCIELLRHIIIDNHEQLVENIKWNSPNYHLNGNDLITLKVQPNKSNVQIIFHRGAKIKTEPKDKIIPEASHFLNWKTNDRAIATFTNKAEIENHQELIEQRITQWLGYEEN